jgi:outer membrane protein assembly factor BamB
MRTFSSASLHFALLLSLRSLMAGAQEGADWPTHLQNSQRNGAAAAALPEKLSETWVHRAAFLPQPAWPPPALQNYYGGVFGVEPWATHEEALQTTITGDSLYYGSPRNHAVYCVDIATGKPRWTFYTEGPVRYAPTLANGKVYLGSDDGSIYCLDPQGKLLWKSRVAPADRRLPGNGHMISMWPVRGSILIENGKGYACAGIFPEQGTYRRAFDPATGATLWQVEGGFFDGYLTVAGDRVATSGGRVGGALFSLQDGKGCGSLSGRGTYIVGLGKELVCQSGSQRGLALAGVTLNAEFFVHRDGTGYALGRKELQALRTDDWIRWSRARADAEKSLKAAKDGLTKAKKGNDADAIAKLDAEIAAQARLIADATTNAAKAVLWSRAFETRPPLPCQSLILAGDRLFAGTSNAVVAFSTRDGAEVWRAPVTGTVYGLAAARGRLFASTDQGTIHCFAEANARPRAEVDLRRFEQHESEPSALVKRVLGASGDKAGYILALADLSAADLAALARGSNTRVVALQPDAAKAEAARAALDRAGLQGQVAVHAGTFTTLPYPPYFANVVVLSKDTTVAPAEVGRVLQPYGGVALMADGASLKAWMKGELPAGAAFVDDATLRRGELPAAGEWTHQYASPANTACSSDPYVRGKLAMTWFGDPGPREMIDRHNRTMSPLVQNGRLFVPANEKVIALNAYNGVRLWDLPVPGSRRVGVLKDSGQMALAPDAVYIAATNCCWVIDAATGALRTALPVPPADGPRAWGYLAVVDDLVLGSSQRTNASFATHCNMCPILEGDFRPVIKSESLFCLDRRSGARQWEHREGALFNSAIAVSGGRVFLLESRQPAALTNSTGRLRIDRFLGDGVQLVALDLKTGRKLWERPVQLGYEHIIYLQVAGGLVLTMGTYNKSSEVDGKSGLHAHYAFHAFAADTGAPAWQTEIPTRSGPDGSHGEQWQHPVIIGDEIFTKYFACSLRTGAPLPGYKGGGPGSCGTWAASATTVFGRGGSLNLDTRASQPATRISREGCFVNVIPACGVLSVPHTGAGCLCAYPLELSMGFVCADGLTPVIYPLQRTLAEKTLVRLAPSLPEFPIRYTVDGSTPTEQSPLYTQPFEVQPDTTVKAFLRGPAPASNTVVTATFAKPAAK